MPASPESAAEFKQGLRDVGYLPDDSTALVSFLAAKLDKPILVEGPAGAGLIAQSVRNHGLRSPSSCVLGCDSVTSTCVRIHGFA